MEYIAQREDMDRSLSYYTKQQVNIVDKRLGILYYLLIISIVLYIVIYMFIIEKGYLELEQAKGSVATHVSGDAVSVSSGKPLPPRYFSAEELTFPGLENGNIFIATRLKVRTQKRGVCEDQNVRCVSNNDCTRVGPGTCTENGYCLESAWCDQDDKPEIYALETGVFQIWVKSSIQFINMAPEKVFSTAASHPSPERGYNTFTVRDLLLMCDPLPVRYEEVSELGAAIEAQFIWECNTAEDTCHPRVRARRLDTIFDPDNIGFGFSHAQYLDDNTRLLNEMRGVRIFFRTVGTGRKFSIPTTVTKASTSSALISIATIIADLLLVKVLSNKAKYKARKYEQSPDFSDYMTKLNEKEERRPKQSQLDEEEQAVQEAERIWQQRLDEEND